MRVAKGKAVSGKVVFEGEPLDEGAAVTVISAEDDETFRLGAEGERGETISGEELLGGLDSRG